MKYELLQQSSILAYSVGFFVSLFLRNTPECSCRITRTQRCVKSRKMPKHVGYVNNGFSKVTDDSLKDLIVTEKWYQILYL